MNRLPFVHPTRWTSLSASPGKQSSRNVATPPYRRHSQWTAWCNWQLRWFRQHSFYYLGTVQSRLAKWPTWRYSKYQPGSLAKSRSSTANKFATVLEEHSLTFTSTLHDQHTAEAHQPAIPIHEARGTRLITKLLTSEAIQWLIIVLKTVRNCIPSSYQLIWSTFWNRFFLHLL